MHFLFRRNPRARGRRARHLTAPRTGAPSGVLLLGAALLALGTFVGAAARGGPSSLEGSGPHPSLVTTDAKRAPESVAPAGPPANLLDLPAWLEYRSRNHLAALPLEARLFYRRGLMLAQSGSREEAVRMVRGAAELDPGFIAPHLTLASWSLFRDPSQALLQYATVIELSRQNFLLQLALVGNLLFLCFQSLFIGLLAAGLIVVGLRNRELRHPWIERVGRLTSPATARWWSWAILVLPFACGFGLALPTLVFLGLLWSSLRIGERAAFIGLLAALVSAPWVVGTLDRFTVPLRDTEAPFYGVPLVVAEPSMREPRQDPEALARRHPENPFVQFAWAWTARRRGDLQAAEAAYRRALELRPQDDRVMSNLGNVLAMQGRADDALELYRRAGAANPGNAAAAFNASQIYTQRFDYRAATDALSRASALNFELVKTYQSQATNDGVLPLVDEWIAPRSLWLALASDRAPGAGRSALPPGWRSSIECSGLGFSIAAFVLAVLAVFLGTRAHRAVPLRVCSNCGAVLCRRCACRRREAALCPTCAAVESRAETPDFGRLLLLQHRGRVRHSQRLVTTALATLLPGFGLLFFRRVTLAIVLLSACAALVAIGTGLGAPFSYETRLAVPGQEVPLALLVGAWVAIYVVSILSYFANVLRVEADEAAQAAPVRSRVRATGRERSAMAA